MSQRGICLTLRNAETVLQPWRAEHDWTAAHGLPTHVTVRVPLPVDRALTPETFEPLAADLPVHVTLVRCEDRPGALVVLAEPDEALRSLTERFDSLVPGLSPHRGGRADLAYHATVVRTPDADVRRAAAASIGPQLPLVDEASELALFEWFDRDYLRVLWRSSPSLVD